MKVLVTGATGFIGNHVIETLLNQNHSVIATSSNSEKAKKFGWYSKVEYLEYNILKSTQDQDLFTFFNQPDVVIHLAWGNVTDCLSALHSEIYLMSHYFFLKNLVINGATKITVSGTCLEYGMREGCLSEELLSDPKTYYALAKDTLRKLLVELRNSHPFYLQWIRLFYMYGIGQHESSLFAQLNHAIINHKPEFNMSGGEQIRDFLPVEEVALMILKIVNSNITDIINCCSGKPISVKELVLKKIKNANVPLKLNLGFYPYRKYEPMKFWGDNLKYLTIK